MIARQFSRLAATLVLCTATAAPLSLIASTPTAAQGIELADPATLTDEHRRLGALFAELMDANQLYITPLNALRRDIIRQLVSTNPDISDVVTEAADEAYLDMATETGPLFGQIAELYAQAYTVEELETLIAFFQSPAGEKFRSVRRAIDRASIDLTFTWSDAINAIYLARVRELLTERGVEL